MTTLLREVIGDVLRQARLSQGRTLREVSDDARVSLGYLSEVERGRKEASSELLSAICGALEVPLSRVLSDAGRPWRGTNRASRPVGTASAANIEPVTRVVIPPPFRWRWPERSRAALQRPIRVEGCGDLGATDKLADSEAHPYRSPTPTRRRNEPMANPFSKAWKYLMALFNSKVDEYADPKVQIQQAIEEAQRQHQGLTQQAASVIGNQRQLEMRLNRQLADIEKLQVNVRQALTLADQATTSGDAAKATEYTNAAEAFAAQLVTAEQSVEDLKTLHDQALQAAGQAKKAVEQNSMVLQQKIAERSKLLSQLEQAKMQEQVSKSLQSMSEIAAPGSTPSLDEVRDKIERRYANAMGSAELAQNSVQGRMMEVQQASVQMAGHSRLEQIRASMNGEALPSGGAAAGRAPPAGDPPAAHRRKPTLAISHGEEMAVGPDGTAGGVALPGATRRRHRLGMVGNGRSTPRRCRRSAGQVVAQAPMGAAAGLFFASPMRVWIVVTGVLASWA